MTKYKVRITKRFKRCTHAPERRRRQFADEWLKNPKGIAPKPRA